MTYIMFHSFCVYSCSENASIGHRLALFLELEIHHLSMSCLTSGLYWLATAQYHSSSGGHQPCRSSDHSINSTTANKDQLQWLTIANAKEIKTLPSGVQLSQQLCTMLPRRQHQTALLIIGGSCDHQSPLMYLY